MMKSSLTFKNIAFRFFGMLFAVMAFTFFDWIAHSSIPILAVPAWYFTNKIIYATVYAFILSLIFRKLNTAKQALAISAITVLLLQIRYAYIGYPLLFHIIVLPEHFIFLSMTSAAALFLIKKLEK